MFGIADTQLVQDGTPLASIEGGNLVPTDLCPDGGHLMKAVLPNPAGVVIFSPAVWDAPYRESALQVAPHAAGSHDLEAFPSVPVI
jgi:hypothetical protein